MAGSPLIKAEFPRISIVTPNYNSGHYLEETILSVIEQNYPNLEYIVVDGGSSDNSLDIIQKYAKYFSWWISEKDEGMYHAINKGFSKSTGEIMGWLNSDDMLIKNALFTVAEIFDHDEIDWVQGQHTWFDKFNRIFRSEEPRLQSKYNYLLKEYHEGPSPFIQQESTYWKRQLWNRSGGYISTKYTLAGDFELWMRFFRHSELFVSNSLIGGFRVHDLNQQSILNYDLYLKEADDIIDKYIFTDEEKYMMNKITERSISDKIPLLRRYSLLKRNLMYKKFKSINWNPSINQFQIN